MTVDKYGTITLDICDTIVTATFNEYDKKKKKQKQVKMPFTDAHRRELIHQMDSTDGGEFYRHEDDKKVVTGYFRF
jgi:hypothetical protein